MKLLVLSTVDYWQQITFNLFIVAAFAAVKIPSSAGNKVMISHGHKCLECNKHKVTFSVPALNHSCLVQI